MNKTDAKTDRNKIALVTGANRGIGFEIVRQLAKQGATPILASRSADNGRDAAAQIKKLDGIAVATIALDVTSADSIARAVAEVEKDFGPISILVNNAGILIDSPGGFNAKLADMTDDTARRTFDTNVLGPQRLMQAVLPGMRRQGYGRVVNISSMAGQLANMGAGYPAYRMSKAALNALTRIAADEERAPNIKINCMCPGWCRTDMGGEHAERSAEDGAKTAVWLATLQANGPTGGFFQDNKPFAW